MHYGAAQEQFAYYLDEFTFRFDCRTSKSRGLLLHLVLQQCVSTVPHPINYTRDSPRRDNTVDVETEGEPDSSRGSLP